MTIIIIIIIIIIVQYMSVTLTCLREIIIRNMR